MTTSQQPNSVDDVIRLLEDANVKQFELDFPSLNVILLNPFDFANLVTDLYTKKEKHFKGPYKIKQEAQGTHYFTYQGWNYIGSLHLPEP